MRLFDHMVPSNPFSFTVCFDFGSKSTWLGLEKDQNKDVMSGDLFQTSAGMPCAYGVSKQPEWL